MKRALAVCSIAWGIALISAAHAGGIYVTPDGAGARTGADWDNALGSLQAAVDASAADGTIYLAAGNYTNGPSGAPDLCAITNKTSITIRGGYAGTGTPGARGAGESVVQNPTVRIGRLLRARNTALLFDGVVFEGGYLSGKNSAGAGLHLTTCDATFTNCTFRGNHINSAQYSYGAGFWASGCTLQATDCLFTNNYNYGLDTGHYGGAGYVTQGVVTRFTNCRFDHNWTFARYVDGGGGALYLSGGICEISRCHFLTNVLNQRNGYSRQHARGGAICASGLTRIDIAECHFTGNCALNSYYNNGIGGGGIISFEGASQKATINRCSFVGNKATGFTPGTTINAAHTKGDIMVRGGTLAVTNALIADGTTFAFVRTTGGNASLVNCTLADGGGVALESSAGNLTLSHCILSDHPDGVYNLTGGAIDASYTRVQDAAVFTGEGNFMDMPLLAADGFYHPLSRAGYYTGGYFSGGTWTTAEATSPTIDAGAPAMPFDLEPEPNNVCANIGYDANTTVASKSDLGEPPAPTALAIFALPATNVLGMTACARGVVPDAGGVSAANVTIVWGASDAGTNAMAAWDYSRDIGTKAAWDYFSETIPNAVGGTTYYRLVATGANSVTAWSEPAVMYKSARLAVITANETTHISRHDAVLNATLSDDGDSATSATVAFWADGGSVTSIVEVGTIVIGDFSVKINGLSPGTLYGFRITALNMAGASETGGAFTTCSTAPITRYVTVEGAGLKDGSDWANAYGNLQEALDVCFYAGDMICMQSGVYLAVQSDINELSHYVITNAAGLTIAGGYLGDGTPGARGEARTILKRDTTALVNRRILRIADSSVALDGIDIEGGYRNASSEHGGGGKIMQSTVSLTNCVVRNNHIDANQYTYGGGIYASQCTLTAVDCVFSNNYLNAGDTQHYGGAVHVDKGVATTFTRCLFDRNWVYPQHWDGGGGALYLTGGVGFIAECTFTTNSCSQRKNYSTQRGKGAALWANNMDSIAIVDSTFVGNCLHGWIAHGSGGGVLHFSGATQKATITRCAFLGNEWTGFNPRGADYNPAHLRGDIQLASGVLAMTNVLIASSASTTNALTISGGNAEAINVTITDYDGHGAQVSDGALTLMNTILWGNAAGSVANSGGSVVATYTCAQNQLDGEGNISADPLFVDAPGGNYRLGRGSPCGNVGNRRAFPGGGIDLDGNSRISAGIDLGCYESRGGALMLLLR